MREKSVYLANGGTVREKEMVRESEELDNERRQKRAERERERERMNERVFFFFLC